MRRKWRRWIRLSILDPLSSILNLYGGEKSRKAVHLASRYAAGPKTQRLLLPGDPAAHGPSRLPLLPSGPDGVQQRPIAQDLTINTAHCTFGN